jgi:hypothetical protein
MFHEERRSVPETVGELQSEYVSELASLVADASVDDAADRTGLDEATLEALLAADEDGSMPDLCLEEAAAVQSLADGAADPDTIVEIGCDHLLLGMSTAVLDVDTLAAEVDEDITPKEVQQKLERRSPMTFEEYVALQYAIAARQS